MSACPHGEPSPMCCIECLETTGFGEPVRPEERTGRQTSARRESVCPRCRAEIDIDELLDLGDLIRTSDGGYRPAWRKGAS